MVQLNSFDDLLSLSGHPHIGVSDIYKRLIDRAIDVSSSEVAVALFNSSEWKSEGESAPDLVRVGSPAAIERAWKSSRAWTGASRMAAASWVAENTGDYLPYMYGRSIREKSAMAEAPLLGQLADSASSLWLPLLDGEAVTGWVGLGTSRANAYTPFITRSLEPLISSAVLALNRLRFRQYAGKRGLEINWIGGSQKFLGLERAIKQVADQNRVPVLIRGERGSGKELAAYAVHYFSRRRDNPFVPVLASALSETLQVDELFGHEKNSFTGASTFRKGKFLSAEGGTLFLDEVADLPPTLQVALLRVLDQGEIQPIGRDLPVRVDVRIIAATNRDLEKMVAEGRFRDDLYDRLNVLKLNVPPLRERVEDIPLLARYFLLEQCVEMNRRRRIDQSSICHTCDLEMNAGCATENFYGMLKGYGWPGNVRELRNLVIQLSTMSYDKILDPGHLPVHLVNGLDKEPTFSVSADANMTLDSVIRSHIEKILETTGNNQTQAAKMLGIARTTLQGKMRKLGMAGGTDPIVYDGRNN